MARRSLPSSLDGVGARPRDGLARFLGERRLRPFRRGDDGDAGGFFFRPDLPGDALPDLLGDRPLDRGGDAASAKDRS